MSSSYRWLCSQVIMALDLRLDGREFDSRPTGLELRWVTVFRPANHLSISPSAQANSASYPQRDGTWVPANAVTLCGWGVKDRYGSFHLWINVWVAGKLCDPSLTRAIPERFTDIRITIKQNEAFFIFIFYCWSGLAFLCFCCFNYKIISFQSSLVFTDYFSGPGRVIDRLCVSAVRTISFERNWLIFGSTI